MSQDQNNQRPPSRASTVYSFEQGGSVSGPRGMGQDGILPADHRQSRWSSSDSSATESCKYFRVWDRLMKAYYLHIGVCSKRCEPQSPKYCEPSQRGNCRQSASSPNPRWSRLQLSSAISDVSADDLGNFLIVWTRP
jgi:hypothetical protein